MVGNREAEERRMARMDDVLYQEVDDSCALCGIRGDVNLTIHHIDQDPHHNEYDNKIVLCHNCHTRFHDKKGITEDDIRDRKRHLIVKTLTTFGVNALKIASRHSDGVVAYPFLMFHLIDLGYAQKEETVMDYGVGFASTDQSQKPFGTIMRFSITESGRALVKKWF